MTPTSPLTYHPAGDDRRATILSDFRRNALFLIILALGFIHGLFGGYSNYLWILLIPFIIYRRLVRISTDSLLIITFSVAYMMPMMWQMKELNPAQNLFLLLYPLTFYYAGQYLCQNSENRYSVVWMLMLCIVAYGSYGIWVNFEDFFRTGSFVNITRTLRYAGDATLTATHYTMMLCMGMGCVGAIFLRSSDNNQKYLKIIGATVGILGLLAALHLLNRTAVVLVAISCLIGVFWGGITPKRAVYLILVMLVLTLLYFYLIDGNKWFNSMIDGFSHRSRSEHYSVGSAGGRTYRWMTAIQSIAEHPWGTEGIRIRRLHSFAHNMWLDVGVRSGWLAFALIIWITVRWTKSFVSFLKNKRVSNYMRGFIFMILTVMLIQMAVEPVIEGQLPLMLMFFLNWGFLTYDYDLDKGSGETDEPENPVGDGAEKKPSVSDGLR